MIKRLAAALLAGVIVLTCSTFNVNAASVGGVRSKDVTIDIDDAGNVTGGIVDGKKYRTSKSGTSKSGTSNSGSTKSGTTKSGTNSSGSSKSETNQSGTTKSGTNSTGSTKSGTTKSGTTNSGTAKSGTNSSAGTNAGTMKPIPLKKLKSMTEQDWVAWFAEEYPYALNDLYGLLPYNDMIGSKLDDLKLAIENNKKYSEETSAWTTFETMTGYKANIAYAFSDRVVNAKGENAAANGFQKWLESLAEGKSWEESINDGFNEAGETIDRNISKGAANAVSSAVEEARYFYVVTDGSKDQIINRVYVVTTGGDNIQKDFWEPIEDVFYNVQYKTSQVTYNNKKYNIKQQLIVGNVAKIDYQKAYECVRRTIPTYEGAGWLKSYTSVSGSGRCVYEYYGAWLEE